MEIIVDAYDGYEQAAGWHAHLSDRLRFPFRARCVAEMRASPLRVGDEITVTGMDDAEFEMRVVTEWAGRAFSVPLAQIEPETDDEETETAAADWRYWTARGYTFH